MPTVRIRQSAVATRIIQIIYFLKENRDLATVRDNRITFDFDIWQADDITFAF